MTPSGNLENVFQYGGSLYVVDDGSPGSPALVNEQPGAAAGQVVVKLESGFTHTYSNVSELLIFTRGYQDKIIQNTTIPAFIEIDSPGFAGAGGNSIFSKSVSEIYVNTPNGGDTVQDTVPGASQITVVGPNSGIFGGTGNTDFLYGKNDTLYNIVGPSTDFIYGANTFVYTNAASTVNVEPGGSEETFAAVFGPGQAVGSFYLTVTGNTVLAGMDNAGDTFVMQGGVATLTSPTNGTLTVNYGPNVNAAFGFGGNGTDTFEMLDPSIETTAFYGQGGTGNLLYTEASKVAIQKTGATGSTAIDTNASVLQYATGGTTGADTIVEAGTGRGVVFGNGQADNLTVPSGYQFISATSFTAPGPVTILNDATLVEALLTLQHPSW